MCQFCGEPPGWVSVVRALVSLGTECSDCTRIAAIGLVETPGILGHRVRHRGRNEQDADPAADIWSMSELSPPLAGVVLSYLKKSDEPFALVVGLHAPSLAVSPAAGPGSILRAPAKSDSIRGTAQQSAVPQESP